MLKRIRTAGKAKISQITKKKESSDICQVCANIIRVSMFKEEKIELGSFQDVMLSTNCEEHRRLLHALFGPMDDVKSIRIMYDSGDCDVHFDAHVAKNKYRMEKIYRISGYSDGACTGRLLDKSWIDSGVFSRWKGACDGQESKACKTNLVPEPITSTQPMWLVDTLRLCLVSGTGNLPYVALSYLWGQESFFKTTKETVGGLQLDQALKSSENLGVPRTIRDAFSVVGLLAERYLWVDSLCIVQDDETSKRQQINSMASIFGNATVTIIAKKGENADFGLRGLNGISPARSHPQQILRLQGGHEFLQPEFLSFRDSYSWDSRGWTFQEGYFSRRCLTFEGELVSWKCACCFFIEDFQFCPRHTVGHLRKTRLLSLPFPSLEVYSDLVGQYNDRDLTYPEDALSAFAGITTVLSQRFLGGFVCALPVLFLDLSLCWHPAPYTKCERRRPSNGSIPTSAGLPSWSWIGWKGKLFLSYDDSMDNLWNLGCTHVREGFCGAFNIIPIVQWKSRNWKTMKTTILPTSTLMHEMKERYVNSRTQPPEGWIRHTKSKHNYQVAKEHWPKFRLPKDYYVYESHPETKFWHPIPLHKGMEETKDTQNDTLLCCQTQRAFLYAQRRETDSEFVDNEPRSHYMMAKERRYLFSLRDAKGNWAGAIFFNDIVSIRTKGSTMEQFDRTKCELVAISRGNVVEGPAFLLPEDHEKERPHGREGALYEFYNVLWVEWEDGIAFRKAYARVSKDAWEALDREDIDLVLG